MAVVVVFALAQLVGPPQVEAVTRTGSVLIDDPNCQESTLPRGEQAAVTTGPSFMITFYGEDTDDFSITENGDVHFIEPYFDRPVDPWGQSDPQFHQPGAIAPFYADVDTADPASGQVHWGRTFYQGRYAWCVDWFTRNPDGSITGVRGAGQGAKENIFQLFIVRTTDPHDPSTEGDFDVIFNYDSIQWETQTRGVCPQAGFSRGTEFPNDNTLIQGSGQCGAFLDSNQTTGLTNNTNRPLTEPDGRWIFSVKGDHPPTGANASGRVVDENGIQVAGASVTACRIKDGAGNTTFHPCRSAVTDADGHYSLGLLLDGTYSFQAFPPSGSELGGGTRPAATIADQTDLAGQDIVLTPPVPLPGGTSIRPRRDLGSTQVPAISPNASTLLKTTEGCPGGVATWTLTIDHDDSTGLPYTASGQMTERTVNRGTYVGTVPAPFPHHGFATVTIAIHCPDGTDQAFSFNLYIDPSGVVKDTKGHLLADATVTLFRSESGANQFAQVPDQSVIMSPGNRTNPDLTDANGHFGWDVLEGDYKVRATSPGCTAPGDPSKSFVETGVLPIPPPVTDLVLVLACPSRPSEVSLAFNDPVPSDPSDPCRSGTTFKRNDIGTHDDLTVCTFDADGEPLRTDTFTSHLEWSTYGTKGGPSTLRFNPFPPLDETSGAAAAALVGLDALSAGDNYVQVDLVSSSGTVLDSSVVEEQVRAPSTTRDIATRLGLHKAGGFMRGKARAAEQGCRLGRAVTLFRRHRGRDPVIGTDHTNQFGRWRIRSGRRRGTYYARVAAATVVDEPTGDTLNCLADQSRTLRRR